MQPKLYSKFGTFASTTIAAYVQKEGLHLMCFYYCGSIERNYWISYQRTLQHKLDKRIAAMTALSVMPVLLTDAVTETLKR